MLNRILIVFLFLLAIVAASSITLLYVKSNSGATQSANFDEQKVGELVKDFLTKNPNVIVESFTKAREVESANEQQRAESAISENRTDIENANMSPTAGNKDGDVVIVAFHDYNCGFCRKSVPDLVELINTDKNIKFVMKDFPILGDLSVEKAKASTAVYKLAPDRWFEYYQQMSKTPPQNVEGILEIASKFGINPEQLKTEMNSEEVQNKVKDNLALGQKIGVRGTPAFIVGGKFVAGAIGLDNFKDLIAAARANGTGKAAPHAN